MNVQFRKRFLKELAKVPPSPRKEVERFIFQDIPSAKSLAQLAKIEAMRGYLGLETGASGSGLKTI